jgi:trk system potassium uptake protein
MQTKAKGLPSAVKLLGGLAALVAAGALLLLLPPMSLPGRGLDPLSALFTSVSALTVTGLSGVPLGERLSPLGLVLLGVLIQLGGVGYMVCAVIVFRLIGRSIGLADRLALQDSLGLLNPRAVVQLTQRVFITVILLEGLAALFFFFYWGDLYPPDRKLYLAVFHSVSSFCNAFFDITTGSPFFPEGVPQDPVTWAVAIVLAFLGGLGIPVLYEILTWRRKKRFSLHTKVTLVVKAVMIFGGGTLLWIAEARPGGALASFPWPEQALMSFAQSSLARAAGGAIFPEIGAISAAGQLVLLGVMFVGAGPASMGGGITTGTFAVMALALIAYAKGREKARIAGREIPHEMVRKAFAVLTISLLVVLGSAWLLVLTHPFSLSEALFESVSAFSTCGLSLDVTSRLNPFGQAVVMLTMIWGRLGALTILFIFTRSSPPGRITYPEEKVLIG